MTLEELRAEFPGYHVGISLFPSGGLLTIEGCDECGTHDSLTEMLFWGEKRTSKTIGDAVKNMKKRLGL